MEEDESDLLEALFPVDFLLLPPEKSYLPNMYSSTAKLLVSEDSIAAFFFAVIADFVRNAWHNIKNDSEWVRKLKVG